MVMVHLRTTESHLTRSPTSRGSHTTVRAMKSSTAWHTTGTHWASRDRLIPRIHLSLPPHASTPQADILVAVSPTINGPLNQTSFSTEALVELSKSPSDSIALGLVVQPVSTIIFLSATCSRIDTILRLEFSTEFFHIHRLNVTTDRIFQLDAITGVFESNPLNAIVILLYNQRGCCWNRTWSRAVIRVVVL